MTATPTDRAAALRTLAATPSSALFAGPRGSGKAQAAQEVATALGAPLRRVDLSQLIGPDIAGTEKAIDALFDAAARDGALLMFDEADALFAKRTQVRDAHDRYANAEASYLLARIEAHPGAAILATNRRQDIDPAFLRRLRFVVDFPPPAGPPA